MYTPLPWPPYPTYPSEGWILNEDRALRDLMKGMVVSDQENRQRKVEAWFGHPDQELREQKFPYVTIDLLGIEEGKDRVHRGDHYLADPPHWWGMEPLKAGQVGYLMEMPTPVDLDYQISTWARNPRHDRQLLFQLITGGRTMLRGGLLFDADHKIHRLDYLGHIKRDTVENGKRLFNNVFRVRISSEVPWGIIGMMPDSSGGYWNVGRLTTAIKGQAEYHGMTLDEFSIIPGEITDWDSKTRRATVIVEGTTVADVPASLNVSPVLVDGDTVSVSKEAKVPNPAVLGDYQLLIVSVER